MPDGTQTKAESIPDKGQTSPKVATPSEEQAFYKSYEDFANAKHSKLDKGIADRDKYLKLAQYELGERDSKLTKLQEEMDGIIAKGEGGVDVAKKSKEIRDREAILTKKEQMQALKDAELAEVASQLHTTKLNDLIDDLCTAKESDLTLRSQLVANVKSFNPKTPEDVERIVGLLNVKPAVKTPVAGDVGSGGGGLLSDADLIKKVGDLSYTPSSAELKRVEQILIKRKSGG